MDPLIIPEGSRDRARPPFRVTTLGRGSRWRTNPLNRRGRGLERKSKPAHLEHSPLRGRYFQGDLFRPKGLIPSKGGTYSVQREVNDETCSDRRKCGRFGFNRPGGVGQRTSRYQPKPLPGHARSPMASHGPDEARRHVSDRGRSHSRLRLHEAMPGPKGGGRPEGQAKGPLCRAIEAAAPGLLYSSGATTGAPTPSSMVLRVLPSSAKSSALET